MEFKDIASVSGKPGLFQILKPTRNGVILESIDAVKTKIVINTNSKVSILKDITVYTTGAENVALSDILIKTHELFAGKLPVNSKSDDKELKSFLLKVVPDYDTERVYISDIKKMVNWYTILQSQIPEVLTKQEEQVATAEGEKDKKKATADKTTTTKTAVKAKNATVKNVTKSAPPKKATVARKAQ